MKLLRGIKQIAKLDTNTVATIGNFDGVHLGHQALLKKLSTQAKTLQLPMVVLLFEPQPSEFFKKEMAPARLDSFREKIIWLKHCGVDFVCCLKFDNYLASMTASQFANEIVFSLLKAKYLLIGQDFRFGHGRLGDANLLYELGRQLSSTVESFPDYFIDNQRVSSTAIRSLLKLGKLGEAELLLGRPYSISGIVVHGDGRGRLWGIKTANLNLNRKILPLKGVYCVRIQLRDKSVFLGVANIGCRPTVDGSKFVLEVHLFDVDISLYGERLDITFMYKLRDEIKFESVDLLIAQIKSDIINAKNWFTSQHRE